MMMTLIYFALALLLLVTIHEYGHFIVARLMGVKVLRFSFGFGKVLFSWQGKRGTEYALSAVPLGGYVKMLDETEGDVDEKERHLAFNNQPVFKRIAIVIAGPLFNFLFAVVAFWLVLVIGIKSLAPIIDQVKPGSLAEKAGLTANQEIISLDDSPVASWRDFQYALLPLIGSDDTVAIGVKSLDDGQKKNVLLPLRGWSFDHRHENALSSLGIVPFIPSIPPIIGDVMPDSPATHAGFRAKDTIKAVDGQLINDWIELVEYVKNIPDKNITVEIERNNKRQSINVKVGSKTADGKMVGYLGIRSQKVDWPKQWLRFNRQMPWTAAKTAVMQTADLTSATFVLIGRLVTGKLGLQNLSGPIGIAQGAGESGRSGLTYYLSFLALISISLGVINLLPIPVLDGGHLLYCLCELILRRPLSEKTREIGMYFGLFIIILLMFLAVANDLLRLIR